MKHLTDKQLVAELAKLSPSGMATVENARELRTELEAIVAERGSEN